MKKTLRDSGAIFKNSIGTFEDYDNIYCLTKEQYKEIVYAIGKKTSEMVLRGEQVFLPHMGSLQILGKRVRLHNIDGDIVTNTLPNWAETKKLWEECPECKEKKQLVFHLNEHSSGISYIWKWSKKRITQWEKLFYRFQPTRANKRALAKKVKSGQDYFIR